MKLLIIILFITNCLNTRSQTTSATLNGSASSNAVSYHWKQISGPTYLLQTPDSVICKVNSLTAGVAFFELTCTNPFGVSKDSVMITVLAASVNIATITNAVVKTSLWTDKLSWTTSNESNVDTYLIEKSTGAGYSKVINVPDQGNRNYSFSVSRPWFSRKPLYRVTPVFKDGSSGFTVNFK